MPTQPVEHQIFQALVGNVPMVTGDEGKTGTTIRMPLLHVTHKFLRN